MRFSKHTLIKILVPLQVSLLALVLLWPVHLKTEGGQVESLNAIESPVSFSLLFSGAVGASIALGAALRAHPQAARPLGILLGIVPSLVFRDLWLLATPSGRIWEEYSNAATTELIAVDGYLRRYDPGAAEERSLSRTNPNLSYLQFPGFHLIQVSLIHGTGLDLWRIKLGFSLYLSAFWALITYLLLVWLLKDTLVAYLATLLYFEGNWVVYQANFFYPLSLGLTLFTLLCLVELHLSAHEKASSALFLARIVLYSALVIIHPPSALAFGLLFLLLSVGRSLSRRSINALNLSYLAMVFLAWIAYRADPTLSYFALSWESFAQAIRNGSFLWYVKYSSWANFGESFPFWVRAVRVFWLLLLPGLGSLIALRNATRFGHLSPSEMFLTAGMLAAAGMGILAIISPGGGEYHRFLLYGATFSAGLVMLKTRLPRLRPHASFLSALVLIALSFPTFLAHNAQVASQAVFPFEKQTGEFIGRVTREKPVELFSNGLTRSMLVYYVPYATFFDLGLEPNKKDWSEAMRRWVRSFKIGTNATSRGARILVYDRKLVWFFSRFMAISERDPEWAELRGAVGTMPNFYDSGYAQLFLSSP